VTEATDHVLLQVPPAPESAAIVRLVVRRLAPWLPPTALSLYLIALTEIVVNAGQSHAAAGIGSPIEVQIELAAGGAVTVRDTGGGIPPDVLTSPRTQDRPTGLQLVRSLCSDAVFSDEDNGTSVRLPYPGSAQLSNGDAGPLAP